MRILTRGEFDALSYRLNVLETQQNEFEASVPALGSLSGTLDASIQSVSGTMNAEFNSLSGTVNARFLNVTGSLISSVAAISASLNAGVTASIAAAYYSLQIGSTASIGAMYTTVTAGSTASIGAIYAAVLVGTSASDAAVQTSLKVGVTASVGDAYSVLQIQLTSSVAAISSSLNAGITASFGSWAGSISILGSITASDGSLLRHVSVTGSDSSLVPGLRLKSGSENAAATFYAKTYLDLVGAEQIYAAFRGKTAFGKGLLFGNDSGPADGYILYDQGGDRAITLASQGSIRQSINGNLTVFNAAVSGIVEITGSFRSTGDIYIAGNPLSATLDAQHVSDGLDMLRGYRSSDDFTDSLASQTVVGGAATSYHIPWEPGHPGIVRFDVAASGTDYAGAFSIDSVYQGFSRIQGGPFTFECCIRIATVDDGANDVARRLGNWNQQPNSDIPTNGAWFELNRSRYGDNEWRFRTAATSSQATFNTGVTVANNRWYRLRVDYASEGDAVTGSIFCSGTLIGLVTTATYVSNAGDTSPGIVTIKTLGATSRTTDLDYMFTKTSFTGSRI